MVINQIRDIAIIIIAVQSIVIGVLIGVLAFQVWRLVKMVQLEIKPILNDLQETVGTVRGTTNFVSNNVVEPVVKTSGYVAGVRRTVSVMQGELNATMRSFRGRGNRTASPSSAQSASTSSEFTASAAESMPETAGNTNSASIGESV